MKNMIHFAGGRKAIAAVLTAAALSLTLMPAGPGSITVFAAEKKTPVVYDTAEEMMERSNMLYRLTIPDCSIDVAVFNCNTDTVDPSTRQPVTDAEDSACAFNWQSDPSYDLIIADHAKQGFRRIEQAVPGQTLMYLNGNGTTAVYRCIDLQIGLGTNTGYDLLDKDGRSLLERQDACIVTYTCHGLGSTTPSYAVWEPIGTVANTADADTNLVNAQNMIAQEDAKHQAQAAASASDSSVPAAAQEQ
ncbi:MAG: hypothetical protein ACI4OJ_07445 [Lachnospiraceae bacterium]